MSTVQKSVPRIRDVVVMAAVPKSLTNAATTQLRRVVAQ
jgi:hypothetical protein